MTALQDEKDQRTFKIRAGLAKPKKKNHPPGLRQTLDFSDLNVVAAQRGAWTPTPEQTKQIHDIPLRPVLVSKQRRFHRRHRKPAQSSGVEVAVGP